ncbi:MAG TPA: hypothetical protein VLA74_03675 [Nitrososphaeraceae archaeon]|nr:hypothetical protein [Nitrososphaeraceae archaeon]
MVCKGICSRHKAMRPKDGGMRYLKGQKRCQVCQVFIYWRGSYCPCCGYKLRVNPRNGKFKLTLRNKNNNKKQHKESITNLLD